MGPAMKSNTCTKGQWLTIQQKCDIIDKHERCPALTLAQLARWALQTFELSHPPDDATIFRTLRDAATIRKKRQSAVTPKGRALRVRCPELEEQLAAFILSCQRQYVCLSRRLITKKAQRILASLENPAPLKLSDGWLTCFTKRHGLRFRTMYGEAASVDSAAVLEGRLAMQDITRHYALRDVWNMDETGLMYRSAKQKGICKSDTPGLKKDKTRSTIALAANADGSEKRPAFYIGRARRPHCYKGIDGEELGFYYRNNKKAWMTRALYTEWIKKFDRDMRAQGRDIHLLVDNASSHDLESGKLTNITVQNLPPNTTSHLQPMDAGIIASVKSNYRERHLELACNRADDTMTDKAPEGKSIYYVDQLQGMMWSDGSWDDVSQETIANCFMKSGVVFDDKENCPPVSRHKVSMNELLI